MSGSYFFYIVGRNDNLIYESDFVKQSSDKKV